MATAVSEQLQEKIDDLPQRVESDSSLVPELLKALQERTERDSPSWFAENVFVGDNGSFFTDYLTKL